MVIKNIIFDWGGVLTKGKHTAAILEILQKEYDLDIEYKTIDDMIRLLDRGDMDSAEFIQKLKEHGLMITEAEMRAVFEKAIHPNKEVIKLAEGLNHSYRVIMFSNNNKLTVEALREDHKEMLNIFEKTYFSYEHKTSKPDLSFFKMMIKDAGLDVDECVIIDDKEKNIDAAKQAGIRGILFKNDEQLKSDLIKLGVNID